MLVNPAWVTALAAVMTVLMTLMAFFLRWFWRLLRRLMGFLDDFFGLPAHDGFQAVPGVMARLRQLENMVQEVKSEVQTNTGHSLKDSVNRAERDIREVRRAVRRLSGGSITEEDDWN